MSWTKGAIVRKAFAELALAGYVYDLDPEEIADALDSLDLLMAEWHSQGLRIAYNMGGGPDASDETDESGLPLVAVSAVYLALAVRISSGKGKALTAATMRAAKASWDALVSRQASNDVTEQQFPSNVPRGAGSKPWRTVNRPFMPVPKTTPLLNDTDGGLDFAGSGD